MQYTLKGWRHPGTKNPCVQMGQQDHPCAKGAEVIWPGQRGSVGAEVTWPPSSMAPAARIRSCTVRPFKIKE